MAGFPAFFPLFDLFLPIITPFQRKLYQILRYTPSVYNTSLSVYFRKGPFHNGKVPKFQYYLHTNYTFNQRICARPCLFFYITGHHRCKKWMYVHRRRPRSLYPPLCYCSEYHRSLVRQHENSTGTDFYTVQNVLLTGRIRTDEIDLRDTN